MMKSVLIGTGIYFGIKYSYRKATEFETNVYVEDKNVNDGEYTIHTDKGKFLVGYEYYFKNDGEIIQFGYDIKKLYNDMERKQSYHIKAYGLDYPEYGLFRTVVSSIGTPCDNNNHCEEKQSLINKIF